jgi:nicotinamidase-related amidase
MVIAIGTVVLDRCGTTLPCLEIVPTKNEHLHGFVPDQCNVALILADVINDMDFDGGEELFEHAWPAAKRLAALVRRARAAGVPIIYVNDNFGRWRSDFQKELRHVIDDGTRGAPIAELLRPADEDYFVLKAKHSGFYHTQLDLLIDYLKVKTILLAGFATDICVLFTAADAHMRDLHIIVPRDCSAAGTIEDHERTIEHIGRVLQVSTPLADEIDFGELLTQPQPGNGTAAAASPRSSNGGAMPSRNVGSKRLSTRDSEVPSEWSGREAQDRSKSRTGSGRARSPVDAKHVDAPNRQDNKRGHRTKKAT